MKLTCVTATFNPIKAGNRDRLIRCVESVAKLKTEHEHLIYDGASTDGTVELLREIETKIPGLKVVTEPDTGIYNALNKGVRDAKGEWFYVLGCDDYIAKPEIMDEIISGIVDKVDVVVTEVYQEGDSGGKMRGIYLHAVLLSSPYCHQGVMLRSGLVRRYGGFDERYKIAADYKLMLLYHLNGVNINYRFGKESMFACFGLCGLSESNRAAMDREFDLVLYEQFGVKGPIENKGPFILPLGTILRLLCHPDAGVCASARYLLKLRVLYVARFLMYPLVVITRPFRHGGIK